MSNCVPMHDHWDTPAETRGKSTGANRLVGIVLLGDGCCCCCDSLATLLLPSVIQVEEVCDRGWIIPQILRCELRRVALTVEQMLYGGWCHSTLRTNIWYATGDAGLVTVQEPTVTGMQLGKCGTDWPRKQIFKRWHIRWWSSKDSVWYKIRSCVDDCLAVKGA